MNEKEEKALTHLQRVKSAYRSYIKINFEHAAQDCGTCPTRGACCTDAHFVNVHITRLEAVAIRETLARTPRLNDEGRRAVYKRAREAVERHNLLASGNTFKQTFSCPLYEPAMGCLVHGRAKPAPCIQHACYDRWEDLPPTSLQARTEHRVEQLNTRVYGAAWAWLPLPLWLTLVDPDDDGVELQLLARQWGVRTSKSAGHKMRQLIGSPQHKRTSLPIIQLK